MEKIDMVGIAKSFTSGAAARRHWFRHWSTKGHPPVGWRVEDQAGNVLASDLTEATANIMAAAPDLLAAAEALLEKLENNNCQLCYWWRCQERMALRDAVNAAKGGC